MKELLQSTTRTRSPGPRAAATMHAVRSDQPLHYRVSFENLPAGERRGADGARDRSARPGQARSVDVRAGADRLRRRAADAAQRGRSRGRRSSTCGRRWTCSCGSRRGCRARWRCGTSPRWTRRRWRRPRRRGRVPAAECERARGPGWRGLLASSPSAGVATGTVDRQRRVDRVRHQRGDRHQRVVERDRRSSRRWRGERRRRRGLRRDVAWSGADAGVGHRVLRRLGVRGRRRLVAVALRHGPATSARFPAMAGQPYRFDVQARDFAGNLQSADRTDARA